MTDYIKVYTGNIIMIQLIKQRLEAIGINPIIKDESESGRLAGFGTSIPNLAEIYVHTNEHKKANSVIETIKSETEVE